MHPIAFVDCETTHLDAEIGEAWEVAVILRTPMDDPRPDTEYLWQFAIDQAAADPEALRIGRFHERHLVHSECGAAFIEPDLVTCLSRERAVEAIVNVLRGAVIVGSNPAFDDRFLRKLLGPGGAQWHYRPYDIVQLAAAKIGAQAAGPLPWSSRVLSRAVGVEPPTEDTAHTALGDARWARDVYDAATTPQPFELTPEDRARHAIGLYVQTAIELEDARRALARQAQEMAVWRATVNTLAAAPAVPVSPPPVDRAAVLREAAAALEAQTCECGCRRGAEFIRQLADEERDEQEAQANFDTLAEAEVRRMADEAQQPTNAEESPADAARRYARRLAAVENLCSGKPGYHSITVKALLTAMSDADDDQAQQRDGARQ